MTKTYLLIDVPHTVKDCTGTAAKLSTYSPHKGREVFTGPARVGLMKIMSVYKQLSGPRKMALSRVLIANEHDPSFRFKLLPRYKSTRAKTRKKYTSMQKQQSGDCFLCKDLIAFALRPFGIYTYAYPGLEADDVMGYFSYTLEGGKILLTTDGDMLQLCGSAPGTVEVMASKPGKGAELYGLENMASYYKDWTCGTGLEVLLYKAICGDNSDDYKGVPGIGDGKFNAFLADLRTMPQTQRIIRELLIDLGMWARLAGVAGLSKTSHVVIKKVQENRPAFDLSLKLAKLVCKVRPNQDCRPVKHNKTGEPIHPSDDFEKTFEVLESYGMLRAVESLKQFKLLYFDRKEEVFEAEETDWDDFE